MVGIVLDVVVMVFETNLLIDIDFVVISGHSKKIWVVPPPYIIGVDE